MAFLLRIENNGMIFPMVDNKPNAKMIFPAGDDRPEKMIPLEAFAFPRRLITSQTQKRFPRRAKMGQKK